MPRKRKSKKRSRKKTQPTKQELMDRIRQLEEELSKLKDRQAIPSEMRQMFDQLMGAVNQLRGAIESGATVASEKAEKLINDAKGLVIAIANDPKIARAIGYETGINVATLQNIAQRIIEGKVSHQEIICAIDNAWNIFKGYFIGDQAYKEVVGEVEKAKAKASEKVDKMVELDEGDRS